MSDYHSSLPVRTETAGDVISKLCDGTTNTQQLAIDSNGRASVNVVEGGNEWDITGNKNGSINIAEQTLTAVAISKDQTANTELNPIFVSVTNSTSGGEVHHYKVATVVGSGLSDTHTYTVTTGKTLLLKQIEVSGSGKVKAELKVGTVGSTVSKWVGFNSTGTPMIQLHLDKNIEVASTDVVEVIITNREQGAISQDLYSTIIGQEI